MRLVTFAHDMAPFGTGDTRLVPDDVAERLAGEKALSANEAWPRGEAPRAPQKPARPILKPERPSGGASPRTAR